MKMGAFEAKTHFSELLEGVQTGNDYTITKRGKPVARIIPYKDKKSRSEIIMELSAYRKKSREVFNIKEAINDGRH